MADQTTRARRALDAQSSRFLELDSAARAVRINVDPLAEITAREIGGAA